MFSQSPQQLWLPPPLGGYGGALDGANSLVMENLKAYCYLIDPTSLHLERLLNYIFLLEFEPSLFPLLV